MTIHPGKTVPDLQLELVGGGHFDTKAVGGYDFTLLAVYRGYHCPKCRDQLQDLRDRLGGFGEQRTRVVAASMDETDRAARAREEWELGALPVAYGMSEAAARDWHLFISTSRGATSMGVEETRIFAEPGLFLIRADATLYAAWIQTVPFARPGAADLVSMIAFVREKDYPPRGMKMPG